MRIWTQLRCSSDEGAVAVTVALVLTLLVMIAALVVDLGFVRADNRANQTHADFAALAAAGLEASAPEQCREAVAYFAANTPEVTSVDDTPCGELPASCTSSTVPVTTSPIAAGPYQLFVTHPVGDMDDAMRVSDQAIVPDLDGVPCDRMKTEVYRERDFFFGPVQAFTGGGSAGDAVVIRHSGGDEDELASLIVLEPYDCRVLNSSGGANIDVVSVGTPGDEDYFPGIITVDSEAFGSGVDCNTNNKTAIVAPSASGKFTKAADFIFSYGLRLRSEREPYIYNDSAVPVHLSPRPTPGRRITRAPVDHKFNCRASYPAPGDPQMPRADQNVKACEDAGSVRAYVDELRAGLQSSGTPAGFVNATGTGACPDVISYDGTTVRHNGVDYVTHTEGKLRIQCSPKPGTIFDIVEAQYVVFDQLIDKMDTVRVHGDTATGAVVYFRSGAGGISVTGGTIDLQDAFVYADSLTGANANLGGSSVTTWLAPVSEEIRDVCETYSGPPALPPAGCFSPLALWSNSSAEHSLGGAGSGGGVTVSGSFFAPNAPYKIHGGTGFNFQESQFFALRLRTTGGGTIEMVPNPNTYIPIPLISSGLIR